MTQTRSHRRWSLAVIVGSLVIATGVVASAAVQPDFVDEVVFSGLSNPTNVEFAPDGRVFVAEKGGLVKVFDSLNDPSPDTFADLSFNVHDYWDRGLLGLAIHPNFPTTPYVYVLYTYGVPLDPGTQTWGDECPDPTGEGCVVSGRLSRLEASGNQMTGSEVVLIEDWCQQYPSHSIGDLEFGPDGALYASGGDGASFTFADWGQGGNGNIAPENPCGDPPVPVGGDQSGPGAEGGALRSQDLETSGDPVTLDGTIIRIDPITGDALPSNPLFGASDENEERIVAYGLRNPFRLAIDQASGAVYAGDVGWSTWEEVNEHPDPTVSVENFGWPCYEGGSGSLNQHGSYDQQDICDNLYNSGTADASLFAYRHNQDITGSDLCPPANPPQGTSSSISGLDFYPGGGYPGTYNGALFGSDYSRDCIWVMYRDSQGVLDPASIEIFQSSASNPVDIEAGPGGDIYYVNLNGGQVRRFRFIGDNNPPTAVIEASTQSGAAPLSVDLNGTSSSDPDGDDIVLYEWDLDGDGSYDDATGELTSHVFATPGSHTVRLRVTDARGETDTDSIVIQASNTDPTASIDSPSSSLLWSVGENVSFSGHATDPEEGTLDASALTWELILHHCEQDGSCHEHGIQTFNGVTSGSFVAPDHEYPSHLELRLTASDQFGVSDTDSVELQPEIVDLTFETDPTGLDVAFFGDVEQAPTTRTVIVGANVDLSTNPVQGIWVFQTWSHGGSASQSFPAPASNTTYTATFDAAPTIQTDPNVTHDEKTVPVVDIDSVDNADSEESGLVYVISGGDDALRFSVASGTGQVQFNSAPDYENPADSGGDNNYAVQVTVTDSSGLTDSVDLSIQVEDVNESPIATDDLFTTDEDVSLSVAASGVLQNDTDPENDGLTASVNTMPSVGSLSLDPDGSFVYTPPPNWNGQTTFTYEACDTSVLCDLAMVTLNIGEVNDPPIANDDNRGTLEDNPVSVDVLVNDLDIDSGLDPSSVEIVSPPANGNATPSGDGTVVYSPDPDWSGVDQFTYQVDDTLGASSNLGTVTITVDPVNDPPVADAGSDQSILLGEVVSLDGSGSSDPIEGDALSYLWSVIDAPGGSTSAIEGDDQVVANFTPDFVGTYVVELTVGDGFDIDTDQLTVEVNEVLGNLPPEITSDGGFATTSLLVDEGTTVVTDVDAVDPEGEAEGSGLSFAISGGPDSQVFNINPSGLVSFNVAPNFEAPTDSDFDNVYEVVVAVMDSQGATDTQTIMVSVIDLDEGYQGRFKDDDESIFESSIEWLAVQGITLGCNPPINDMFCPDGLVTRGQMAAFFARAFGWSDVGLGDLFVDDDGHLFEHAIDLMGTAGVTKGCNPPANDRFCPDDYVTREQIAAFFKRAFTS